MRDFLIYTNEFYLDMQGKRHESPLSVRKLAEQSVLSNGSDLHGRNASFAYLTGISYKIPVILCDNGDHAWLCTRSLQSSDCILINEGALLLSRKEEEGTALFFLGGSRCRIPEDKRIIDRQLNILEDYRRKIRERGIMGNDE